MTTRTFATLIGRHFAALYLLTVVGMVAVWYFGLEGLNLQGEQDRHIQLSTRQLELAADFRSAALQNQLLERRGDFQILAGALESSQALQAEHAALGTRFAHLVDSLTGAYDRQFKLLMVVEPRQGSVLASTAQTQLDSWMVDAVQRASELGVQELLEPWPQANGSLDFVLLRQLRALNARGEAEGPALGILVGVFDQSSLLHAMLESVGEGSAHFAVGTREGHLAATRPGQAPNDPIALELLRQSRAGEEGTYWRRLSSGAGVVAVYRDVSLGSEKGLGVVHYQAVTEMLDELPSVRNKMLALGGVMLLLGFGLVRWLAVRATAPLAELSQATAEFGAGVKARRAQVAADASLEFVALAQRFNAMADRVTMSREALEAKVEERTQALAESGQRLALALDAGAIGVWDLDPRAQVLAWDERMCRIYGLGHDARTTTIEAWLAHVHTEDRARVAAELDHALAKGEGYESEFRIVCHETEVRHVHNKARVLRDADGTALRVIGVHLDITVRKVAEAELRSLTEHLEELVAERTAALNALFAALPDLYFRVAADGTILDYRSGDEQLLYLPPSAFMGKKMQEVLPPHVGESMAQSLAATLSSQSMQTIEYALDVKGAPHVFEARMLPTRLGDVAIVTRDVSARKQAEVQLARAKETAEAANIAKSAFLANMSHEIRTPLNAILGMAYLIRRDGVSPAQRERLDKLEAAGDHLLEVINTVLDLSKIEAGKLILEDRPLDLGDVTARTHALLQTRAAAKHLQFVVECPPLSCGLRGDPTKLQQALLNYATNAIKFTEQGSVTIRVRPVAEDGHSLTLRFEVIDTGIGVPAEAQSRLFGAFEQADNSSTRSHGGTGLGLVITKRIAELMGGTAGMSSVEGQGSTFWFTARLTKNHAPVSDRPPPTAQSAEETIRRLHTGKHVLLVDDEPINREITCQMLEYAGLVVECANDGAQAVARVEQQPFDLVLMDLQMPNMGGLEASRRIRQQDRLLQMPILALTANAFQEERARCTAAGMNDFIIKPVEPDALFETVCRWLNDA